MLVRQFPSMLGRRGCQKALMSSPGTSSAPASSSAFVVKSQAAVPIPNFYSIQLQRSSFHSRSSSCNYHCLPIKCGGVSYKPRGHDVASNPILKRLLSSRTSKQSSSSHQQTTAGGNNNGNQSNISTKYFTTKTNQDAATCIETELSELRSEIANLSYLIKQSATQQQETQALSRRAEARAYIIENKLMDIQRHVLKIPQLESMAHNMRQYLEKYSPSYVSEALRRVNESSASFLTNKYTLWGAILGIVLFWQYRLTMYQRTSEELAEVTALTLQQDSLRRTIQETLTTVANSPETLASLSVLFQKLISEERTEQHLINLIVRALNSEGVRDAAIQLLDVCFQNEYLQTRAGEFLKVAANATVLDENVQKSAGIGIQQALKSAVVPWWAKNLIEGKHHNVNNGNNINHSSVDKNDTSDDSESTRGNDIDNGLPTNGEKEVVDSDDSIQNGNSAIA